VLRAPPPSRPFIPWQRDGPDRHNPFPGQTRAALRGVLLRSGGRDTAQPLPDVRQPDLGHPPRLPESGTTAALRHSHRGRDRLPTAHHQRLETP
jgi:hypothetical protein